MQVTTGCVSEYYNDGYCADVVLTRYMNGENILVEQVPILFNNGVRPAGLQPGDMVVVLYDENNPGCIYIIGRMQSMKHDSTYRSVYIKHPESGSYIPKLISKRKRKGF